jgi:hypothetical protein
MFNDNTKGTDTIGAFNRHADGTLTPEAGSPFAVGGAGTGTGLADRGAIQITPDGRFLIAADAGCCRLFTSAKCGPGAAQHRWSRRRGESRADLHRGGSPGVAGYQDVSRHRATTISTCGCAPVRAEPSVDVISQPSVRHGGRDVRGAIPCVARQRRQACASISRDARNGPRQTTSQHEWRTEQTGGHVGRTSFSQVEKACSHIP